MDGLPDAILQYIISNINDAKDIASCNSVSKRWKDSTPFIPSLFFPRNIFDEIGPVDSEPIITRMINSTVDLQQLIVYCPFSSSALVSWLSTVKPSLRHLELRLDNLSDKQSSETSPSNSSKLDCIDSLRSLESLKLWGVMMTQSPKWGNFFDLQNLKIMGAKLTDASLSDAIGSCPNLRKISLIGCDGIRSITIDLQHLEKCRLDFVGLGNCSLFLSSPKLQKLKVQGCSWIQVNPNHRLTKLEVTNNAGRVYRVDFGKLEALEELSIKGVQWCWAAVSNILQYATEVKYLEMKIEFTGDYETLQPFPAIHLADFFNAHPKLKVFKMHGAMFVALCQKISLASLDASFAIPCLEQVEIVVRSPLNAEQKMNTLDSLLLYGKKLRNMMLRISQMKNYNNSADEFFEDIHSRYRKNQIVHIA